MNNLTMIMKLTSEVSECIVNLIAFFRSNNNRFSNIFKRVAAALKVPIGWVYNAHKPVRPRKKRNINSRFDSFDRSVIRETIHSLYRKGQYFSTRRLCSILKEKDIIISQSHIRKILKEIGFRFYNSHGKRFAKETTEIVTARHNYLRNIAKYRDDGYEIVYLDETWVNANHCKHGVWTESRKGPIGVLRPDCSDCGRYIPAGKGSRLIILDAGSADRGFIPGVGRVFRSKTKSSDYHDEMNGKYFIDWFENTLLPSLPEPSLIVLDNAPYHNIKSPSSYYPKSNNKKSEIAQWLTDQGVEFSPSETKAALLKRVTVEKPIQEFETDRLANFNGHLVLRLPVRHCELNPIELIQAQEKDYVARHNSTFKIADVETLYKEAKERVTQRDWERACLHVINEVENKFREIDGVQQELSPIIISLESDSESVNESETDMDVSAENLGERASIADENAGVSNVDERRVLGVVGDARENVECVDDSVCKICGAAEPPLTDSDKDVDWVCCDLCDEWLHVVCIGERLEEGAIFHCSYCKYILYH